MKIFGGLAAMVVVSGLVAGIQAGEKKTAMPLDKEFLLKAATINNAEIQIGNLANKRAASSEIKNYASMLVKDHKAAGEKMIAVLKGGKLATVAGFDKETKDEISRLGKLEGNEFDRAFVHCMVKGHKEAIALFENQAKNGQDEGIQSFAKEMLPDLRKHLSKANELAKTTEK